MSHAHSECRSAHTLRAAKEFELCNPFIETVDTNEKYKKKTEAKIIQRKVLFFVFIRCKETKNRKELTANILFNYSHFSISKAEYQCI